MVSTGEMKMWNDIASLARAASRIADSLEILTSEIQTGRVSAMAPVGWLVEAQCVRGCDEHAALEWFTVERFPRDCWYMEVLECAENAHAEYPGSTHRMVVTSDGQSHVVRTWAPSIDGEEHPHADE